MSANKKLVIAGAVVVLVIAGLVLAVGAGGPSYQVKLVLPSAAQLVNNAPVKIDGEEVGSVQDIETRNGMAIVTVGLDSKSAPLHDGTTSRIEWESLLGQRIVTLFPGPVRNPVLPNGALLEAPSQQIEIDQVLATFDQPTRTRLNSLITQLNGTLGGREEQLKQTLATAGPTVNALGDVLQAVGRDGPAIRELITELHQVTQPLAQRRDEVRAIIDNFDRLTTQVAPQSAQLRDALKELPSTLDTATTTLNMIPAATDATVPLLHDLQSPTSRLPSISRSLAPLLRNLRPTLDDLRPTLIALQRVFDRTPDLFDSSRQLLPQVERTVRGYRPVLSFLRPYTPELTGFATDWGNAFGGYDSQGHVWSAAAAPFGGSESDDNPGVALPSGIVNDPAPGRLVHQPWTDANGKGMR